MFHVGLPAWKKSGALVIAETSALEGMIKEDTAYVLIDLRGPAKAGYIKGAVPVADLAAAKDSFPADKNAPIILVNDAQASEDAFKTVRGWGYPNTSVLRGGMSAWKGELGPASAKIEYVKKLKPGEIAIAEFKSIAKDHPVGVIILDVREGGTEGQLQGAVAIPRIEIEKRFSELPKDQDIVIHCNTGILAKIAYNTLKEKGYERVRYLNAVIQVAKDGTYEINEK